MKIAVLSAVVLLLVTCSQAKPFHSAKCLARGVECSRTVATKSGYCRPLMRTSEQPKACFTDACRFCDRESRFSKFPCMSFVIRRACRSSGPSMPGPDRPGPDPTPQPNPNNNGGNCQYSGTDKIVIDLASVTPARGWTRVRREGMSGIIFDKNRNTGTIVKAGTEGVMCFNIKLRQGGQYYTTAITAAPHGTEHNDMWIKSSRGFKLFKNGQFRSIVRTYVKGFQNRGQHRIADMLKTIDRNGHYLITPINSNERFTICIAGRSSKFEVFKIVLVPCFGNKCEPRDVAGRMESLPPTQCS